MGYKKIENQDIHGKPGEQDVFKNVEFINCNFKENLEGSKFIKCRFDNCELKEDLSYSEFYNCNIRKSWFYFYNGNTFDNVVFEKCKLFQPLLFANYSEKMAFRKCSFLETDIILSNISDSEIIDCYFRDCPIIFRRDNYEDKPFEITPSAIISNSFVECNIDLSQLPEYLDHNNFIHCSLTNCDFPDTTSCSFFMCDLDCTMFSGENKYNDYRMCNFDAMDFTNNDLSTCDFNDNTYHKAIFSNTVFNKEFSREILLLTEEQINGIIIKE